MIRAYIAGAFLLAGTVVYAISLLGVFRFRFVLNRLHASAVADTLGTLLIFIGLALIYGFSFPAFKLFLILLILWITGPVSTNRIASAEVESSDDYKKYTREEK